MLENCNCNPFCTLLDQQTREQLCESVTITYQKAKQIQLEKWEDQLVIVSEGVLLTYILLEDGTEKSIELVSEGDLLGTHFLSEDTSYPEYQTMSLSDVKKCHFPIKMIEKLFLSNRQFAQVLLQNISQRHAKNSVFWVMMQSKNGEEKVKYIHDILSDLKINMSIITQEELALIAGVSRITVARAMKAIREQEK